MDASKKEFIKMALACDALQFGEFKLKSGRISPYFFNAGLLYHGRHLRQLGQLYANTLIKNQVTFEHLFGPAYKGLPLATATAIALAEKDIDVTVTFNRKEAKDHGEGGQLIGAPLRGETIIVDDVITAGTAFYEAKQLLEDNGGKLKGVIIALNRCERGQREKATIDEIKMEGIHVYTLITLYDLIEYLESNQKFSLVEKMNAYLKDFGSCETSL